MWQAKPSDQDQLSLIQRFNGWTLTGNFQPHFTNIHHFGDDKKFDGWSTPRITLHKQDGLVEELGCYGVRASLKVTT